MLADLIEGMPDMAGMSDQELGDALRAAERDVRAAEAKVVAIVEVAAQRRAHLTDGHRTVAAWCRASANWSNAESVHRVRTAELVHEVADVAIAMAGAEIGVAQVRELARVHANPRCGDQLAGSIRIFLDVAPRVCFDEFRMLVRRWELLADMDGAHRDADRAWQRRTASMTELDGELHVTAHGTGLSAAVVKTVFDRFCDAEFDADWAATVERWGDAACRELMPRTDAQRRWDALAAMAAQAVSVPADAVAPEPLVNIVCDAATIHEAVTGEAPSTPIDPRSRACETTDGFPIPPGDVLAAMWCGQVRKVLLDPNGVVVDYGRARRLFTGAAREAVLLRSRRCVWPGCRVQAGRCEADHLTEWHEHGATDQANGAPLCRHHNRFKHRRNARIALDPDGSWNVELPSTRLPRTQLPTTTGDVDDERPDAA